MTEIIATGEQAKTIAAATAPVIMLDPNGKVLGQIVPWNDEDFSADEIAKIIQRRREPRKPGMTTAELLAHLRRWHPNESLPRRLAA